MENRSESDSAAGGKEEEGRARKSEPYFPSRATSPATEDDMDVHILDYEDEEDESGEESLLVDLLEEEDDWSRNLGGVKEMLNPDGGEPEGAAVGAAPPATSDTVTAQRPVSSQSDNTVTVEAGQEPDTGLPGQTATVTSPDRKAATEAELRASDLEARKKEMISVLGGDALAYNTIKKAGLQKTSAISLRTGEETAAIELGAFVSGLDGRLRIAEASVNLGKLLKTRKNYFQEEAGIRYEKYFVPECKIKQSETLMS
jgi:hypothetical protein